MAVSCRTIYLGVTVVVAALGFVLVGAVTLSFVGTDFEAYSGLHSISCSAGGVDFQFYATADYTLCADFGRCPQNTTVRFPPKTSTLTAVGPGTLPFDVQWQNWATAGCGLVWTLMILYGAFVADWGEKRRCAAAWSLADLANMGIVALMTIPYMSRKFRVSGGCFVAESANLWKRIVETHCMDSNVGYLSVIFAGLIPPTAGLIVLVCRWGTDVPARKQRLWSITLAPLLVGSVYFAFVAQRVQFWSLVADGAFEPLALAFVVANTFRSVMGAALFCWTDTEENDEVEADPASLAMIDPNPDDKDKDEKVVIN